MSRGPDVGTQLEHALTGQGKAHGFEVTIAKSEWTPWSSATFFGARHRMTITAPACNMAYRWLSALPEIDFALRGHLLADIAILSVWRTGEIVKAELEALTVRDC